jgi:oxygen-dependent protoporphyrinogen oxidase
MSSTPSSPQDHASHRIAIIGGGISGLAAVHRLAELLPRAEFELFEATERLGGVLQTVDRNGFLIERSADNFLVNPPAALDLCRQLGLAEKLLTTDESRRRAFVVRDGRLVPIPEGFFLMSPRKLRPLLASPILSLRGKFRLLLEPFVPRGPAARSSPQPSTLDQPDESIASFVRRRLGREAFERLVEPLVAGIYTADPEQLSVAATMPQFLAYERTSGSLLRATLFRSRSPNAGGEASSDETPHSTSASGARYGLFVAPQLGMTSLVTALTQHLPRTEIHQNAPVQSIKLVSDKWQLDLIGSNRQSASFDAVLIAAPAYVAASIGQQACAALSEELSAIEYSSCAVVSLGYARRQVGHALDGFGFVVPQSERRRIIAGSFASLKYPGRAPADAVLIRVFLGGAVQSEMLSLRDDEITSVAREELAELLEISGEPLIVDVARWNKSMPQYHVGHLSRVSRIEQLVATLPRFALAGNAYRGVGIPQCVASGQAAADRIAAAFAAR